MTKTLSFVFFLFAHYLLAQTQVEPVIFSVERGYHTNSFDLALSCSTPGASIHFTTDGRAPSAKVGQTYSAPITIETTTVVRAMGYKAGFTDSDVGTHTYIFIKDVLLQPFEIDGYPVKEYWAGSNAYVDFDNEMDPEIVDDPAYAEDIRKGFLEIPTMCLALDKDDFWTFYDSDDDEESITSVELIYPNDPFKNEQVNCLIKAHSHNRLKRSMRLMFKSEAGPSKWKSDIFKNSPRNGDSSTDEFDNIVLRAGNNRSWARVWNDGRAAYTRDQWYRDSQIEMSGIGSHGTFVHLFVNGLYWGMYNPVERPDHSFSAEYFGGDKDDWFAVSHGGEFNGSNDQWDFIQNTLVNLDMSTANNYEKAQEYLDIERYIDYLILTWSTGMQDWPKNNWWGGNRNNPPGPFRYYGWDCEWAWDVTAGANEGAWVHPEFRRGKNSTITLAQIWHTLRKNDEFMMLFADRVYKQCFNDGPLTPENSQERWLVLNNFIRNAVVCESARWGDAMRSQGHPTRTRDEDWQDQVDKLYDFMDDNANRLVEALRDEHYYPPLDPPQIIQNNSTLTFTQRQSGTIYYTLDGTDPRLPDGELSESAIEIKNGDSINFSNAAIIKTRLYILGVWSALHHDTYYTETDLSALKITEIMYGPLNWNGISYEDLQFIEIKNTGDKAINMTGLKISDGIECEIPAGLIIQSGAFKLIVSDSASFVKRYNIQPDAQFDKRLALKGERITLSDYFANVVFSVKYDRDFPWPEEAENMGFSLVPVDPNENDNPDDPTNWRASYNVWGSPGEDDTPMSSVSTDLSVPLSFKLEQNYPNPFNSQTAIRYSLVASVNVTFSVFDILGRQIFQREFQNIQAGHHTLHFDGSELSSGVYFCQIHAVDERGIVHEERIKMMLLK